MESKDDPQGPEQEPLHGEENVNEPSPGDTFDEDAAFAMALSSEQEAHSWAPPNLFACEYAGVAVLTIVLDFLFYQGRGGLSYCIAFLVLPGLIALFAPERKRSAGAAAFVVVLLVLAARSAWQCNALTVTLGVMALSGFSVLLAFGRTDALQTTASLLLSFPVGVYRVLQYAYSVGHIRANVPRKAVDPGKLWSFIVPAAVTGAFAIIFVLANSVLRQWTTDSANWLWMNLIPLMDSFMPTPGRFFFWCGCLIFAAAMLRPQLASLAFPKSLETEKAAFKPFDHAIDYAIARNTLVAVNILFLMYNCLDAQYLVADRPLPPGLDHSQYAHQGAFWLTVALALSTLIMGVIFRVGQCKLPGFTTLRIWARIWSVQNLLLALWVYRRMYIYISYNGLTRMRIVGVVGTTLVVLGFMLVMLKVRRDQPLQWLLQRQLLALGATLVLLAVVPLDIIVWRVNTRLILREREPRAAVQLSVQPISPEGLKAILPLLEHDNPIIAEGAAARLGKWHTEYGNTAHFEKNRWTMHQFSDEAAARAVRAREARILELIPERRWAPHLEELRRHTAPWI